MCVQVLLFAPYLVDCYSDTIAWLPWLPNKDFLSSKPHLQSESIKHHCAFNVSVDHVPQD